MKTRIIIFLGLFTLYSNAEIDLVPKEDHDLMAAVRRDDLATVARLLQQKNSALNNARDGIGMTPFLVAAQRQNVPMVKEFLKYQRFVDIHAKDSQGNNALMLTMPYSWQQDPLNIPLIEMLIDAGIDINAQYQDGMTPLDRLVAAESLPLVIKALKAGAKVNATKNALHVAVNRGSLPMVKILLDAGANSNIVIEGENATLLMRTITPSLFDSPASQKDRLEIAKLLIADKVPVNAQDSYGYSALMLAVAAVAPAFVELLLKEGADVTLKDKEGKTAFELADHIQDAKARSKVKALLLKEMYKK